MSEFKGEPDQIIYKRIIQDGVQKNIPYSLIEDKTIWDLPTPSSGETIVQWWIMMYYTKLMMEQKGRGKVSFMI
jgi:hypothetical protein